VQERVLYIELMNGPGAGDGQGEHRADGGRLDHRAGGLIVVDAVPLDEAVKNPASLVPFQGAVGVELVLEDPFAGDDVGDNRMRDKLPSILGDQGIIFFFHGMAPGRVGEGGTDGGGHSESLSAGIRKPRFARVVIGRGLTGGATGTAFAGDGC
jgi:hypothetical protein